MERVASRTGFSLGNDHFTDLDYAHDVLAHKMDDIHSALEVFETTASQLGLHVWWQKIQTLCTVSQCLVQNVEYQYFSGLTEVVHEALRQLKSFIPKHREIMVVSISYVE